MSNPIFVQGYFFPYFSCDRDPTASESIVTASTGGVNFLFFWVNTVTNEIFYNTQNTENSLLWKKIGASISSQAHINDAAIDAATNAPTNLNVLTTLLGSLTGEVNATNTKQNALAAKYNDLAVKFNTLLDHLEAQGLQLLS